MDGKSADMLPRRLGAVLGKKTPTKVKQGAIHRCPAISPTVNNVKTECRVIVITATRRLALNPEPQVLS